ncbi:MAG: alpha-L-fucosidase [Dyadobacter sp.]
MNFSKILAILFFCLITSLSGFAQLRGGGEAYPDLHPDKEAMARFQSNKFGMFLHWGPVTLRGTEIGWSRGKIVPIADYDNLYKEFNPVLFDADKWIKTAKDAGMKYFIITAKHHDGFCLFDSKFTDYDIMSTPYKKDIVKALADACKKYGVDFGIYYSLADWHHPDYATRYGGDPRPVSESVMPRYVQYMKDQLKEVIVKYDPKVLWFDGSWEECLTHEMGMDLYAYLHSLKSDVIINDRIDKGFQGVEVQNHANQEKYAGDYATPEQRVGAYNVNEPWETCMTICEQWAWKPNDKMKSLETSLETLIRTAGGGGNLLYNVGPMPDGRFEQRQTDLLVQMGNWMKQNGEAIYGTKGGPYEPTPDFVSTRKGKVIFIHVLNKNLSELVIPIPSEIKIVKAKYLNNGKNIAVKVDNGTLKLTLDHDQKLPYVLVLETSADTENLATIMQN